MINTQLAPQSNPKGELYMPTQTHLVNLDALIQREDFEATGQGIAKESHFKLPELNAGGFFLSIVRKPDFQRDTTNWSPELIKEFVKSFLDDELIPYTIMWHSAQSGKIFVIDGAHRLSALIAWVNDDYGDGKISRPFFGHDIPSEQIKFHRLTQDLIQKEIGSYAQLLEIAQHPDKTPNEVTLLRARRMLSFEIQSQWVRGDAKNAERSFFKINQNPTTIDPTELDVIRARRKPNAIATRAIIRRGTGHKYWWTFSEERQNEIEKLAREVYDLLFLPILKSTTIKTLDIPIAGHSYSAEAFNMIFDLVNMANDVTESMWQVDDPEKKPQRKIVKKDSKPLLLDDMDGAETISFLKNVRKVARLVSDDKYAGSLGLHPAVYFLSATMKFHPGAFLAVIKFVQELKENDQFMEFTDVRADFEEFLIRHRMFLNQIGHTKGSRTRSLETLVTMYRIIFTEMLTGNKDAAGIVRKLQANPKLAKLTLEEEKPAGTRRRKFSSEVVSAGYLRDAMPGAVKCPICGARYQGRAASADHNERWQDGGDSSLENIRLGHYYCNTGYKEAKHSKAIAAAKDISV